MIAISNGYSYDALVQRVEELTTALAAAELSAERERAQRVQCQSIIDNIPGITYRCLADRDFTTVFISGGIPSQPQTSAALLAEARMALARVIHPDDLPLVRDIVHHQVAEGGDFDLEYRLALAGEAVCWVNDRGYLTVGEEGEPRYLDGMLLDITARKQAQQALHESEARFRVLVDHSPDLIWLMRPDGVVSYVSPSSASQLGYPAAFWCGKLWSDLIHPDDVAACKHYGSEIQVRRSGFPGPEYRIRHADGGWRWHEASTEPVYDEDEQLACYVAISRDIDNRKRREQQMLQMAYHDPLTGLANRPLFMDRLGLALARARREDTMVAVGLLDLDLFKEVNDAFGHDVGDQLLCAVAHRVQGLLRESDTVARFGGDEFVLMLSDLDRVEAVQSAADKIIDCFKRPFCLGERDVQITTSMGLALYPDDGHDAEEIIKRADQAMYRAKRSGRNRWAMFSNPLGHSVL